MKLTRQPQECDNSTSAGTVGKNAKPLRQLPSLIELLAGVTPDNVRGVIDWARTAAKKASMAKAAMGAILPIYVRSIDLEARYPAFIETAPPEALQQTRDYIRVIIGATE